MEQTRLNEIKRNFNAKAKQYKARYTTSYELMRVLSEVAGEPVFRLWNKRNRNQVLVVRLGTCYDPTVIVYTTGTGASLKWKFKHGAWGDLIQSGLYEC